MEWISQEGSLEIRLKELNETFMQFDIEGIYQDRYKVGLKKY